MVATPAEHSLRVTVPLFNTWLEDDGTDSLVDLGRGARIVKLHDREKRRICEYWGLEPEWAAVDWRLEVHNLAHGDLEARAREVLDQMTLVVREPAQWRSFALDRYEGGVWTRRGVSWASFEVQQKLTNLPLERLETLRVLRQNMPDIIDEQTRLAMSFYAESVRELWASDRQKALVLAAIALECLLGDAGRDGLTTKFATRGTHLVCQGDGATELFGRLRKIYAARSNVVHRGRPADFSAVTHLQQFLMRAIPSMMKLCADTGGHTNALAALDSASFVPTPSVAALMGQGSWWSFVDAAACVARVVPPDWRHEDSRERWQVELP
jgi:Apea-like HEPN